MSKNTFAVSEPILIELLTIVGDSLVLISKINYTRNGISTILLYTH